MQKHQNIKNMSNIYKPVLVQDKGVVVQDMEAVVVEVVVQEAFEGQSYDLQQPLYQQHLVHLLLSYQDVVAVIL